MHEHLWAGVELKLQNAVFHLRQMERSLDPPEQTAENVALQASGAIIDTGWQRSIYAHFDAFLSTTRSVPEIIQCCFGVDLGHPVMRNWFDKMTASEQGRRSEFKKKFKTAYENFRALPLGNARHISEHRSGVAPVIVRITGMFGITYVGDPVKHIPTAEIRHTEDPNLAWMPKPIPIHPNWTDFEIDGHPLFPMCQDYADKAQTLVNTARGITTQVHGTNDLTVPPP